MNVSFSTYKNISFARNNNEYNKGFSYGKNDGIKGDSTFVQQENTNEDYEKGYNSGYKKGKATRNTGYATVSDVIQDLIDKGTPRKQAIEFAAQYLGGW